MNTSFPEKYIRACAEKGIIDFSDHSILQMNSRKICDSQVLEAIKSGQVIEYQDFENEDIKVLFQESTEETPSFYVVVAAAYPYPVVVTVCRFKDEAWEYASGVIKRRKSYDD